AVASWMGIRLAEIEVDHRPRRFGDSKYGISRTFRVILDLITIKFLLSFSTNPNRIFGFTGMMFLISGAIFFLVVAFEKMFMGISGNRPLLTISMMLILSGLQFICFGLLAELQIRSYHETTKKAIYAIKKISEKNTT
ncbi:MAG: glycosyltransferase, partial [Candidatus Aureabacteria bacterium]|nr:glycosyltransferase [Candidatus Auribacterota bacterium]